MIADGVAIMAVDRSGATPRKPMDKSWWRHLPAYSPGLNPDEQVWNHAKARLAKLFVATKEEFKAALFSIQRAPELVPSFFQIPSTKYAAEAL